MRMLTVPNRSWSVYCSLLWARKAARSVACTCPPPPVGRGEGGPGRGRGQTCCSKKKEKNIKAQMVTFKLSHPNFGCLSTLVTATSASPLSSSSLSCSPSATKTSSSPTPLRQLAAEATWRGDTRAPPQKCTNTSRSLRYFRLADQGKSPRRTEEEDTDETESDLEALFVVSTALCTAGGAGRGVVGSYTGSWCQ